MTARRRQRPHQRVPGVRAPEAGERGPAAPGGAAAAVHRLQRQAGNAVVRRLVTGAPLVQRFGVDEMKQSLGSELLHKHVGTEPMPDVSTPDGREEAVAAVYYQRAKADRRSMNTVFFADPGALFADLKETNKAADLKSGPDYTTTSTYPAITVLVVGTVDKSSGGESVKGAVTGPFKKLEIQYGPAKPMVKVNKGDGPWAFNHLQQTQPKTLGTKVDLLEAEK